MKLRELFLILFNTYKESGTSMPMLVGGIPRDKVLGILNKDSFQDIDIGCGDATVKNLAKDFYMKLSQDHKIKSKTMDDGHTSLFIGKLKVDFSSAFKIPGVEQILKDKGIANPTSMQQEQFSRDFTCNSLLLTLDLKTIKDPTNLGIADINKKIIKTCLNPDLTLKYNPNRIIRSVYLSSKLDFEVDPEIIEWVKANKDYVKKSTNYYLSKNIDKALTLNPDRAVDLITKMDIWDVIPITEKLTPYFAKKSVVQAVNYYDTQLISIADKLSDLKKKHPKLEKQIDFLAKEDPSGKHKYLGYAVKTLASGNALENEISDVIKLFHKFQGKLDKKDINQYPNFTELRDKLFAIRDEMGGKSKRELKTEIKTTGAKKMYEDDQCVVLYVKDKAAACFYSRGAKWCIGMENQSYFEDYSAANVIFYFLLRKDLTQDDRNYKIAIVYQRDENNKTLEREYFDAENTKISEAKVLGNLVTYDSTTEEQLENMKATKLKNIYTILSILDADAKQVPKSFLARLESGEATADEIRANVGVGKNDVKIVRNQHTPPEILEQLANKFLAEDYTNLSSHDVKMIERIADHQNTNSNTLDKLYKKFGQFSLALNEIADNPNTPENILKELAKQPNYIQLKVASNPSATIDVLYTLLDNNSSTPLIRTTIARHKNADINIIEKLLQDPSPTVVLSAASSDKIPTNRIIELYKSNDSYIYETGIALNPNAPPDILRDIFKKGKDSEQYSNPRTLYTGLARNPSTPPDILTNLVNGRDFWYYEDIKRFIAANPNTSTEDLERLAKDYDDMVETIAKNHLEQRKAKTASIKQAQIFTNYDYAPNSTGPGQGLYNGKMDKYKSVMDFRKKRRNKRKKIIEKLKGMKSVWQEKAKK